MFSIASHKIKISRNLWQESTVLVRNESNSSNGGHCAIKKQVVMQVSRNPETIVALHFK